MKTVIKQLKVVLLILLIFLLSNSITPVFADELSDLSSNINSTKSEIQKKSDELKKQQEKFKQLNSERGDLSKNIETLNSDIVESNLQISSIFSDLKKLETQLTDISQSVDKKKVHYDSLMLELSNISRRSTLSNLLSNDGIQGFYSSNAIYKSNIQSQTEDLANLNSEIAKLDGLKNETTTLKNDLEKQLVDLNSKKSAFESQLASIKSNITSNEQSQTGLTSQLLNLNKTVTQLSQKQKEILEKDDAQISQGSGSPQPLKPGSYYFSGTGRSKYDGHGVGLSQWGAYGMAKNFGFSAERIIKFYYTGVNLSSKTMDRKIVVDGKTGPISFDDYLSGIGEVPDSWPREAIKAQIIAARTYALKNAKLKSDGHYHICGTDVCQVYLGGQNKRWAVNETKNQVIVHNGNLIDALYSAFHAGGSEDNEKIFNSDSGNGGTPYPYLRGVNDSQYAYKPQYMCSGGAFVDGICKWRTSGYSLDELSNILKSNPKTNVGKVSSISIIKGSSNRAWKVTIVGSLGTKTVAGWYFKSVYNNWIFYNKPPSQRDYLYSSTIELKLNQ